MKKLNALLLSSCVLALTACANQGSNAPKSENSPQAATKAASGANACRSIGEGRKVRESDKNDGYMCKASVALNSAEAKEVLSPNIRVSYGSTSGQTNVSRQIANAVGKTPDETCQRAFLNAVKRFQSTATRYKKNSVRLVSYFDKKTIGGSEYECHIGTWNSRVVLKGSFH